ncbi:MAG TPA: hypothetical protein VF503_20650 [Sphingobium sp.]|uniref:hypothetical protein n=1 Tax=Sphingobium sp. TaxID=1912891 RepID=UPI002ED3EEDC
MKNAYVLEHHFGDDGGVDEGAILLDVTTKRFDDLEKKGLVREATAEEVKKGRKIPFERDTSDDEPKGKISPSLDDAVDAARREVLAAAQLRFDDLSELHADALADRDQRIADLLADHASALAAEKGRADEAEKSLAAVQQQLADVQAQLNAASSQKDTTIEQGKAEEKKAPPPENKKAADPKNRAG